MIPAEMYGASGGADNMGTGLLRGAAWVPGLSGFDKLRMRIDRTSASCAGEGRFVEKQMARVGYTRAIVEQ